MASRPKPSNCGNCTQNVGSGISAERSRFRMSIEKPRNVERTVGGRAQGRGIVPGVSSIFPMPTVRGCLRCSPEMLAGNGSLLHLPPPRCRADEADRQPGRQEQADADPTAPGGPFHELLGLGLADGQPRQDRRILAVVFAQNGFASFGFAHGSCGGGSVVRLPGAACRLGPAVEPRWLRQQGSTAAGLDNWAAAWRRDENRAYLVLDSDGRSRQSSLGRGPGAETGRETFARGPSPDRSAIPAGATPEGRGCWRDPVALRKPPPVVFQRRVGRVGMPDRGLPFSLTAFADFRFLRSFLLRSFLFCQVFHRPRFLPG